MNSILFWLMEVKTKEKNRKFWNTFQSLKGLSLDQPKKYWIHFLRQAIETQLLIVDS